MTGEPLATPAEVKRWNIGRKVELVALCSAQATPISLPLQTTAGEASVRVELATSVSVATRRVL